MKAKFPPWRGHMQRSAEQHKPWPDFALSALHSLTETRETVRKDNIVRLNRKQRETKKLMALLVKTSEKICWTRGWPSADPVRDVLFPTTALGEQHNKRWTSLRALLAPQTKSEMPKYKPRLLLLVIAVLCCRSTETKPQHFGVLHR